MDIRTNAVAFKTILYKEVRRYMRIWVQTLTPPAVNAVLYMLIFGEMIGNRIGSMGGHDYIDFITPGIIMMSVITNSYANVSSSFFSAKLQRHIEEMLVSPVHNAVIVAGYVAGGVGRGLTVGAVVAIVTLFFTRWVPANPLITLSVMVATAVLFALGGLINAMFARTFDEISIVPNFVLTPLTYLGGIFFSIENLPGFWQNVSLLNPVLYMINGFRYGILGSSDIDIRVTFLVLGVFILGFATAAMLLMNRGKGIKN